MQPPITESAPDTTASRPGAGAKDAPRPMRGDDLLRFVWIADPQISPDGERVAFTRVHVDAEADEYRTSLWIASVAGGAPRPLTFGQYDMQPRWSPDGRMLAFVRKPDAKKPGQLHVLPMGGGEARAITSLAKGVAEPAWSLDGTRIAFLSGTNPALDDEKKEPPKNHPARIVTRAEWRMNGEDFRDAEHLDHVWVVGVESGAPRQLTYGRRFAESQPRWSRDGHRIYFLSDRREQPWFEHESNDLWAVSPDAEKPTDGRGLERITEFLGPILGYAEGPDGAIAAVGSVRTPGEFHTFEANDVLLFEGKGSSRAPRVLTSAWDFDVWGDIAGDQHPPRGGGMQPLGWADGGKSVLVTVGRHGASLLARVDRASGAVEEWTPASHEIIAGTVSADGARVAVTVGSHTRPGDLGVVDAKRKSLTRLWGPNDAMLSGIALSEVEEIWYESFDGRKVHGWIVKPPGFDPKKKYPLILEIHGGPHVAFGVGFFHEFHALAAAGYVVLYTNPRGSTTYGWEFANLIQYAYPGDDYSDLMAGVDEMLRRGYVDESRMGVTGGSGGGLLTNWIVTKTTRFKAAITQRCVTDWATMYYSADFSMFTPWWFKKPPYEDPGEYSVRSPVAYLEQIETPLMVIHSEEDWRTPIAQGETMFRALLQRKKPTVMVRFPGESHELSRSGAPSRRLQNQNHIRGWFDRWLMGASKPEYDPPTAER